MLSTRHLAVCALRSCLIKTIRTWHKFWKWNKYDDNEKLILKVDVPILPCVFYTFNWLTLTSEMYFVRFHPEVTSCLLSRGKTKYATLGMRLWWKYIRNYLLVYQLTSHFLPYLQNYNEFEGEISDLQLEKYGLSFETKKYTTSGWARGDENVIGIRAFKVLFYSVYHHFTTTTVAFMPGAQSSSCTDIWSIVSDTNVFYM